VDCIYRRRLLSLFNLSCFAKILSIIILRSHDETVCVIATTGFLFFDAFCIIGIHVVAAIVNGSSKSSNIIILVCS
jgi:hypothetical protein